MIICWFFQTDKHTFKKMNEIDAENVIIIPLYQDWESLEILIRNLEKVFGVKWNATQVIVVDDFSLKPIPSWINNYDNITVVELIKNVGHQKAIAIGLCYAVDHVKGPNNFIVMDSDGEDLPEDIHELIKCKVDNNAQVCFAHRHKRSESFVFKSGYKLYKVLFKLLTGKK
jgi:hypothetical protein